MCLQVTPHIYNATTNQYAYADKNLDFLRLLVWLKTYVNYVTETLKMCKTCFENDLLYGFIFGFKFVHLEFIFVQMSSIPNCA